MLPQRGFSNGNISSSKGEGTSIQYTPNTRTQGAQFIVLYRYQVSILLTKVVTTDVVIVVPLSCMHLRAMLQVCSQCGSTAST